MSIAAALRRTVLAVALMAPAAALTTSCGHAHDPGNGPHVHVGALTGTDAVVAIAMRDRDVAVYVCGGPTSFSTLTRWFIGQLPQTGAPIELTADGYTLRGTIGGDGVARGTLVDPQGTSREFTAPMGARGTLTGLFTVIDDGCRTGVVVTQQRPGDEPTVQGTWCGTTLADRVQQVNPIRPIALTDGVLRVQVQLTSGARMLDVQPVELPLR